MPRLARLSPPSPHPPIIAPPRNLPRLYVANPRLDQDVTATRTGLLRQNITLHQNRHNA
eukprot:CAMPEP_0175851306 /NCGR_PEP_ID=MMETSP0107_2-20121207/25581_1 /TAXON_ID=195067 ORGANISM="Goniomonas pacifica, Strain CCMP1869" /NCGR_SAMPLE_ID=MMETSP0107_2 /ASSEMBLY_ACC=CAM_ASM_000203 /LENGTH=58 /DNA_ID=CAMNT_0017166709 /DNA_START=82 /DNA_END=258 /DNA_ORIENTATION=-